MRDMYQRTLQGEDKTNNHAEAANRRLRGQLLQPTIWNFIHALKRVRKGRVEYFENLSAGHEPQPKLLKCRKADERILKIVSEYGS
ncbi:hypothetical protein Hamer_G027079 [Homarus americanus]|uniref:Transposase n=1 Tax=Homarus americanus TaxID=6706 RepID=A0A8J5K8H7_HOMAM|nr:hypothetical protein Hamer_G027079 [Homarus americanus]